MWYFSRAESLFKISHNENIKNALNPNLRNWNDRKKDLNTSHFF